MIKNKLKYNIMNLKHLFFLAVAGTLAVACSEVNENSLTDGDGQRMLRTISSGNDRFTTRLIAKPVNGRTVMLLVYICSIQKIRMC